VEYAECYRRGKPALDAAPLLHRWARGEVQVVTVTSGESLHNLFELLGKLGQQWLKKTPLFVPHARIAETARSLGLEQVVVTAAGDEGLLTDLIAWQKNRKQ
jgi:uroporphyrinogen-III synthase